MIHFILNGCKYLFVLPDKELIEIRWRMKNKIKLLLFLVTIAVTGCLNYVQEVVLYPDGSGTMQIDYWMKLPDEESRVVAEKIGLFNPDSVKKEFGSDYTKIESVTVFTDSTDSTTHTVIRLSFERIDSLNNVKAFADAQFVFRKESSGLIYFSQFIPPIATGFGIDASKYHVVYKYTFGGKIINHNAKKVDGRTLVWDYALADIGSGKTIFTTFRPFKLKKTPDWIYMLTGAVLALVIFFLLRKKKD